MITSVSSRTTIPDTRYLFNTTPSGRPRTKMFHFLYVTMIINQLVTSAPPPSLTPWQRFGSSFDRSAGSMICQFLFPLTQQDSLWMRVKFYKFYKLSFSPHNMFITVYTLHCSQQEKKGEERTMVWASLLLSRQLQQHIDISRGCLSYFMSLHNSRVFNQILTACYLNNIAWLKHVPRLPVRHTYMEYGSRKDW